jgi:hypothetical protein
MYHSIRTAVKYVPSSTHCSKICTIQYALQCNMYHPVRTSVQYVPSGTQYSTICTIQYALQHNMYHSIHAALHYVPSSTHFSTICTIQYALQYNMYHPIRTAVQYVPLNTHCSTICAIQYALRYTMHVCLMSRGTRQHTRVRCYATSRKVASSSTDEVAEFLNLPHPSSCTMARGFTQPLTESQNLSGNKAWWARNADNLNCHL